jgi:hypothetical protein
MNCPNPSAEIDSNEKVIGAAKKHIKSTVSNFNKCLLMLLFSVTPVWAVDDEPVATQMIKCSQIDNDKSRLACYDKNMMVGVKKNNKVINVDEFNFPPLYADLEEPRLFVALGSSDFLNKNFSTMLFGTGSRIHIKTFKTNKNKKYKLNAIGMITSLFNVNSVGVLNNSGGVLINTDFVLGGELVHSISDKSAFRFKYYHKSTHLGDEFLINNPSYLDKRVNLSYEAIDLVGLHQFENWSLYSGVSAIVRSEPRSLNKFQVQSGIQYVGNTHHGITPILGLDLKSWQANNWNPNLSLKAGFEFNTFFATPLQLTLDIYDGKSPYGQFFNDDYKYIGLSINHYW